MSWADLRVLVLFAAWIIFLLIFVRTAIFDLQDVQGDRLVGKETIVVFLGEDWSFHLILASLASAADFLVRWTP